MGKPAYIILAHSLMVREAIKTIIKGRDSRSEVWTFVCVSGGECVVGLDFLVQIVSYKKL